MFWKILFFMVIPFCKADRFEATLGHILPRSTPEEQQNAAFGIIERLIPEKASLFNVSVDTSIGPTARDTFKVIKQADSEIVNIIGTSGVAVAWGFHHYLKYYCGCHVSWEGTQLNLPQQFPEVNITITSQDRFRYYQNVCTVGYSFIWWDWERWEREIDWMAMNSINLALSFTGEEAIWQRVYRELNLTQEEIDEHFTGPAFLSWNRMGNIRGWGGPLSDAWHTQSVILQHRILNRMRDLGIIPVLPAFAGHVPRAFKRLFPNVNMTMMGTWNNFPDEFCCPYLLDPTDTLFQTVGRMFISELIAEFGTDHVYNCDTFNEMQPSSGDLDYLAAVSSSTFEALTNVDPQAVWMIQSWFFNEEDFWTVERAEAYINAVPNGRMIILDLQSELRPQYGRLQSYFGQPFIWCMLHNFGGTLGLYGAIENVNSGVFEARNMINSTMVGTGLTPEGINQNYVMYDFMNEMSWRDEPANLTDWFSLYAVRRYGEYNLNADEAWQLLKSSLYNCTTDYTMHGRFVVASSPSLTLEEPVWYSISDLLEAWDNLLIASDSLYNSSCFKHDVVDVTRQALQVLGSGYYLLFVSAYKRNDIETFQSNSEKFLSLLGDLDVLLGSSEAFLLGTWISSAKALATTPLEEAIYEYNARNQITLWGPNGEIIDYANKQWSGVVSNYFLPRWTLFVQALNETLINNSTFNETEFKRTVFEQVEEPFTLDTSIFPDTPNGNSIDLANQIHARWRNEIVWRRIRNKLKVDKKFKTAKLVETKSLESQDNSRWQKKTVWKIMQNKHKVEKTVKIGETRMMWFNQMWMNLWKSLFESVTKLLRFYKP